MIPSHYVSQLKWDIELGGRLKSIRGKLPRRELAIKVQESGQKCSHQYIQKLEMGTADSVSLEIIEAICAALEVKIGRLIDSALWIQSPR